MISKQQTKFQDKNYPTSFDVPQIREVEQIHADKSRQFDVNQVSQFWIHFDISELLFDTMNMTIIDIVIGKSV